MLNLVNFAGIPLLRPGEDIEKHVYTRIKDGVFARFEPGLYSGVDRVNEVAQHIYTLYTALLDEHLAKVQVWHFAGLMCQQYDLYAKAEAAYKKGEMNADEEFQWSRYAGHSRRGIKYLLELACQRAPIVSPVNISMEEQEDAIQTLVIAAEELVQAYMRSDYYVTLLDYVELTLDPLQHCYFSVPSDANGPLFDPRLDLRDAAKYISPLPFERNVPEQDVIIGDAFYQTFGARYANVVGTLSGLIKCISESGSENEACVLARHEAINLIVEALSVSVVQADLILAGFSLTAVDMGKEGRLLYRPKQEYRARRRAFFVFPSPEDGRPCLMFSKTMATECVTSLAIDISYRHVAPEWSSPAIRKSLNRLKLHGSKWFEGIVARNLTSLGIQTVPSVKQLVFKGNRRERLPAAVGEIDLLGYSRRDRLLIVIEAKQVIYGTEPKMFLADLQKFITDSPSYASKFEAKYKWIIENVGKVRQFLEDHFRQPVEIDGVGYAMFTHHPLSIASRITDFSCVNLAQFMRTYENEGKWTFSMTRASVKQTE